MAKVPQRKKLASEEEPKKMNLYQFVEKVNKDARFRAGFLENPVASVRKYYEIKLKPEQEKELESAIKYLRADIKHIFEIPVQGPAFQFLHSLGFEIGIPHAMPEISVRKHLDDQKFV